MKDREIRQVREYVKTRLGIWEMDAEDYPNKIEYHVACIVVRDILEFIEKAMKGNAP